MRNDSVPAPIAHADPAPKKKTKKNITLADPPGALPVKEATPLDRAEILEDKLLKYAGFAHKYHIGLMHGDMSENMSNWMKEAAESFQKLYNDLKVHGWGMCNSACARVRFTFMFCCRRPPTMGRYIF